MPNILAFSGSSSSTSINQQLVAHAASLFEACEADVIDIRDYDLAIYSKDIEVGPGIPQRAHDFRALLGQYDGYLVACPEHNGSMPAMFKNLIDWVSRIDGKIFGEKPIALISTSPGKGGGATNLKNLATLVPWWGGKVTGTLSVGSFGSVFDEVAGTLTDETTGSDLREVISELEKAVLDQAA